jgi:hypothetical protein
MRLNSRIYTNSYAGMSIKQFYIQRPQGNYFSGTSVPQYKSTTYYSLANNGAGAASGSRVQRFSNNNNIPKPQFL